MSVEIQVPDELYRQAMEIAEAMKIPVDEVFASAFAEQLKQRQRIQERAKQGSRGKFARVLAKVPDVAPEGTDRLD